ncbi:uncharacterized protein LOC113213290 [Frankliniella occidentalis]|uniref:Uncharacterized protein LOC113213290 n=1 Tax=Frankliniella occidentalis TaxID=133901 RepID=A0A6J1T3E5_FRAOC|nr:uncharacterized protein LOC113213290 [Frankliniella occidentalis]
MFDMAYSSSPEHCTEATSSVSSPLSPDREKKPTISLDNDTLVISSDDETKASTEPTWGHDSGIDSSGDDKPPASKSSRFYRRKMFNPFSDKVDECLLKDEPTAEDLADAPIKRPRTSYEPSQRETRKEHNEDKPLQDRTWPQVPAETRRSTPTQLEKDETHKTQCCAFCTHQSRWPAKLRQHIERFHSAQLKEFGKQKIVTIMFWKSKSNVRRISHHKVTQIVNDCLKMRKSISANELYDAIKIAYEHVLVKIADDEQITGNLTSGVPSSSASM